MSTTAVRVNRPGAEQHVGATSVGVDRPHVVAQVCARGAPAHDQIV